MFFIDKTHCPLLHRFKFAFFIVRFMSSSMLPESAGNSPKAQATIEQLSSLIQLVSAQMDPLKNIPESEKVAWLYSAMKGRKNLIQYLSTKIILDVNRSKNEHRLSLLLLAMILRMASRISDSACRGSVLSDLQSIEGFWHHILSLVSSDKHSVSIRSNALSLCINAYRLINTNSAQKCWPSRVFSESTVHGVLDLVDKQRDNGSSGVRVLLVCLEFLLLAGEADHYRLVSCLSMCNHSTIVSILELCGQIIIAGERRVAILGFDPVIEDIEPEGVRKLANHLIELGGERIYTPLALACIDSC